MKTKKRILTILLCMTLVISVVPACTLVSADSDVVFELDTDTLNDKSSNGIALSTLGTITTDSFTNKAGETVSYMTTGQGNDALNNSSTAGFLRTTDEKLTKLKDYTIEAWMRYKLPVSGIYPKMFKFGNDAGNNVFTLEMPNATNGNKLVVSNTSNYIIYDNQMDRNALADTWAHYVITFDTVYDTDGTTIKSVKPKMYVNGNYVFSNYQTEPELADATKFAMLDTITEVTIGGYASTGGVFGRAFPADFATFKIYNTVKTQDEVTALYNDSKDDYAEETDAGDDNIPDAGGDDAPDVGGDLDIEEGGVIVEIDTAELADCSGNNIAFTEVGTITNGSFTNIAGETVSYMTTGQANDDLKNSSTAGYLRTTDENIIKLKDYTIETWVRYKNPASGIYPKMFKFGNNAGNNVFTLELPDTSSKKLVVSNTQSYTISAINIADFTDKWAHYVITFDTVYDTDGTTIKSVKPKMYVNGSYVYSNYADEPTLSDTTKLAMLDTITELTIGGSSSASGVFSQGFPADFASFKIYNGVKSQKEAEAMYNDSKDRFIESTISASSVTFEGGKVVAGAENVALKMPDVCVEFKSNVNMETVDEDTLKLVDKTDGLEVPYTVTVDGDKAIVSIQGELGKNKAYRVEITEGILKDDNTSYGQLFANFTTVKGAYADNGWSIQENSGTVTAALTAKSDNAGGDFAQHILIVYEICEDYILPVLIEKADATVTSGTDLTISADVSVLPAGNYRAVSTLWGDDLEVYENKSEIIDFTID